MGRPARARAAEHTGSFLGRDGCWLGWAAWARLCWGALLSSYGYLGTGLWHLQHRMSSFYNDNDLTINPQSNVHCPSYIAGGGRGWDVVKSSLFIQHQRKVNTECWRCRLSSNKLILAGIRACPHSSHGKRLSPRWVGHLQFYTEAEVDKTGRR